MQPIIIHFSKKKIVVFLFVGILFLIGSFWMIYDKTPSDSLFLQDRFTRYLIGIAGIVFSLFLIYHFIKKLRQSAPALVIDDEGIIDHSSAFTVGRVYWKDIFAIQENIITATAFSKEKTIAIILCDPQSFIDRYTSTFAKKMMEMNYNTCNTPFHISARSLTITHQELLELLRNQLVQHQV